MGRELLPNELLWEEGHASEIALSAIADGEESLVARDVVSHVHGCDACACKLGELALVTRGVTHAIESVKPWLPAEALAPSSAARKRPTQPVPMAAVVFAMVVAALGAMPTILALPRRVAELIITFSHTAPILGRSGVQVFEHGLGGAWLSIAWLSMTCACAVLLVLAGVAVTRLIPRPTAS